MENTQNEKNKILFAQLVISFHTAAMQHLGKMPNPINGKIERDLPQASMSIDMLDMVCTKCRGNLTDDEENFINHMLSELKLNYVDEVGREEPKTDTTEQDKTTEENADSV